MRWGDIWALCNSNSSRSSLVWGLLYSHFLRVFKDQASGRSLNLEPSHLLSYELVIITLCRYVCHQVAEELHSRADKNEPDKYDFIKLASRVEEFTLRFLDPLKYERLERQYFFNNPETDFIVETAIRLKQKKVIVKRLSSLCLACQTSPVCYSIIDSLKISYQK